MSTWNWYGYWISFIIYIYGIIYIYYQSYPHPVSVLVSSLLLYYLRIDSLQINSLKQNRTLCSSYTIKSINELNIIWESAFVVLNLSQLLMKYQYKPFQHTILYTMIYYDCWLTSINWCPISICYDSDYK